MTIARLLVRVTILASFGIFNLAPTIAAAADSHSSGHDSGGHSGGSGKKGPKYQGGRKGESHSSQTHSSGSHKGGPTRGGSKATEDKVFGGHDAEEGHTDHDK